MLDENFLCRMHSLLGEDFTSFTEALSNEDAVRGVRINTLKTDICSFLKNQPFRLTALNYAQDGFIVEDADGIGNTPEHHSGMIYVQDPGAMATLNALDIMPGWRVLDACAAPGGKSGQAAAKIGERGFLLSNEFVPKRAKTVVSNFERLGVKNAIVTSLDTAELPKLFSHYFDLVIADVPCSGEGMFRKSEEAISEWSEENVKACARRQRQIIKNVAPLVRTGGFLLYSTCTYSLEENEMVVDAFLKENRDFSLVKVKDELANATRDGIVFSDEAENSLVLTRRFYPHVSRGEGQFIALMRRDEGECDTQTILYKDSSAPPTKAEMISIDKFFKENLTCAPKGRIIKVGENLIISEHGVPIPPRSVFSAGVLIGRIEKGLLFPSHQFFAAYGKLFIRQEKLTRGEPEVIKYLSGEEISARCFSDNGWCSVTYESAVLGGGKASLGKIKNHYPKGLRIKK